jgi:hypothetical protein
LAGAVYGFGPKDGNHLTMDVPHPRKLRSGNFQNDLVRDVENAGRAPTHS